MEKLDMSLYVQSGEGANGCSYDLIGNPEVMVKMYNEGYDTNSIFVEQEVARKVYELGIPSPEPGEMVTDGKRIGIRFKRIVGKRSYSRMLADEPERVGEFSREFARYCKNIHSVECPDGLFPDAKEQFLHLLDADRQFSASQKKVFGDFIRNVPECTTALHGDMHMGNAISTLGHGAPIDSPHNVYFIDLGYFSRGCPLFDMGMMNNICLYADDDYRYHDFHIRKDISRKFWDGFVDEYFFGPENLGEKWFGKGVDAAAVEKALEPFYAVKMLLVEYNLGGVLPPGTKEHIDRIFGF
ncbi:MAG: phosphotransferase [Bacteroidales bacterium]|nr:phosphotransferase [Bacteroidales bacterium]